MPLNILSRKVWGARSATSRRNIGMPTSELWLHHTAGAEDAGNNDRWADDVKGIQSFHMNGRGWSDIAYSFLVDQSGQAWEGRGAGISGAHTANRNSRSHGICAIGNFEKVKPSDELLETLAQLVAHGYLAGWWSAPRISGPHRDAPGASTACCGKYLIAEIPSINARANDIANGVVDAVEEEVELPKHARADVESLYRTFAGREGDEDGILHWMYSELTLVEIGQYIWVNEGLPKIWAYFSK